MLRLALVLWAIPIVLLSLWTTELSALVLLAIVGLATTSAEVASLTLLQRTVPDEVLARVFGVLESVGLGCVALGSLMAPILVAAFGTRGALASAGAFLLVAALLAWSADESVTPSDESEATEKIQQLRGATWEWREEAPEDAKQHPGWA